MKQIIYIISLIFLSGACTDEKYTDTPSPEGGEPGELVPVELVLSTRPVQSPLSSGTKAGGDILSSTQVCQGMEISLVKTPVTRAFENEIENFWVFQFEGTIPESKLLHKHFFEGNSVKNVELTQSQGKCRIIVLANTSEAALNSLTTEGTTTLAEFNKLAISYAVGNKTSFPWFNDASGTRMYFSGSADMAVAANKQVDIMLFRGVARVNVNLSLSTEMAGKGYTIWKSLFVKVPAKSFYYSMGRIAEFPGENAQYIENFKELNLQLGTGTISLDEVYLPINLQNPVPFTTPDMRVTNAPPNATYLQVVGMQMDGTIIKNSVVYQIHIGNNFTDDYSVSPNLSYTYDIRITGESNFDSRVVKFIPGYFGGALKTYKNDVETNPAQADTWRFEKRIEVYLTDVNDRGGTKWLSSGTLPNRNDFVDGRTNTWDLRMDVDRLPAIKKCLDLNGSSLPPSKDAMVWYTPSYGQSLGIYVSGSNTLRTLPNTYYWSSTTNGGFVWGTHIWTGQSSLQASESLYNLRCIKDLDQSNTMQ